MAVVEQRGYLKREAYEWVTRLTSGRATAADAEAMRTWCAQSPAHAQALAEATLLWETLGPVAESVAARISAETIESGTVGAWDKTNVSGRPPHPQPLPIKGRGAESSPSPLWGGVGVGETPARLGRRAFLGGAVAASAAAVGALMMRPPFELWPSLSEFAADYRTGPGERRRVAFDDGVAVELNTRTSLTVHAEVGERRRLELVSGEMTVTTGGVLANPLVIAAGDGRVIGTDARVNVRCDGATASVTCLQGTVRVEYRDRGTTLSERQQISYGKGELGSAAAIDPAVVTAWRGGRLVFHGVPLAQVIDEVNRYRRARIILMNTALGRHAVEATFPLDRTDDLVSLVQKAYGAKVRMLPGGMTILS